MKKSLRRIEDAPASAEQFVRVRLKNLEMPLVGDGVVLGRFAALGVEALCRALALLSKDRFCRVRFPQDSVISDAVVRESVLRKIGEGRLIRFLLSRVQPLMVESEIFMLDVEVELVLEDTL